MEKARYDFLRDHFDVAQLLGHLSFDHLAKALSVYSWIKDHNLNQPSCHHWTVCLGHGAKMIELRRIELQACVQAIVLFQAMMEKIPNLISTIGKRPNPTTSKFFAESWNELLDQIVDSHDRALAKSEFAAYDTAFYKAMRNPIVHGRLEIDIDHVNLVSAAKVHSGMKAGWNAYDLLLAKVLRANGHAHKPTWIDICTGHGVPTTLEPALFPDLKTLSKEYMKRHLAGATAAGDAH